ncbi:MAG: DNA-binding domain-containing protein [Pseudomonadota bacterium]
MKEAGRQRALLAALGPPGAVVDVPAVDLLRETGARVARGLEAYRANAESIAERALAAAFPTVKSLVGADDFAHLAREFRHAHPPARGDLGEWGAAMPDWLGAHRGLAAWPWLADCARLDLAVHCNERAEDATLDAASLSLLESADPELLWLRLMPGTALLRSHWPIGAIHAAHRLEGEAAERAFAHVREAMAAERGEQVLIVRRGWRAVVHPLDAATADWTADLLAGASLGAALERAGDGFDFAGWLADALRGSWLHGVSAAPPPVNRAA